ncbi:MAG: T9SS type A sorting domain-containing protein [Bacteroidales bacterium]
MFDIHSNPGSGTSTIFVDNAYSSYYHYDESVTDHRPVGIKLKLAYNTRQDFTERPVSLYPNPATDKIFIEGAKNTSIRIINTSGQCVTQMHSRSERTEIDISALSPGVYGLVIDDSLKIYRRKIIKY